MNKKLLYVLLALLLLVTGVVVYKTTTQKAPPEVVEEEQKEILPEVDAAVSVTVIKSRVKENSVILSVYGLGGKYKTIAYEISYETQGVVQGVTSRPVDVSGKDSFVRDDIYLGTCSRNVCRPHLGVKKISVALEFTDSSGKKSQFSKDFEI